MSRFLSSFFAAIVGGLVVLAGMSIRDGGAAHLLVQASSAVGARASAMNPTPAPFALVAPVAANAVVTKPTSAPLTLAAPVAAMLDAFRTAGLEVGEVRQVTEDSPCHGAPESNEGAAEFVVGQSRQQFCLFYLPDLARRDAVWNALSKARAPYPPRITVRQSLLLVAIGPSPELAARYEMILAR